MVPEDLNSKVNLVFYDGDHSYDGQLESLQTIKDLVEDTFILILDDANFAGVVESAEQFVRQNNFSILFEQKLLNAIESDRMWWNGLHILLLQTS